MVSARPRIRKDNRVAPRTAVDYNLAPIAHPATTRRTHEGPYVLLPNGRALTQNTNLPCLPGQVGIRGDRPIGPGDLEAREETNQHGNGSMAPDNLTFGPELTSPSKHRAKRQRQGQRWMLEVIPSLIPVYMEFLRSTNSLREEAEIRLSEACTCCVNRGLTISVYRFSSFEQIKLNASPCNPAAAQLVRSGLFPCSPIYPTLAVDIRVLDFVRRLFLRVAPNHTAWCNTAIDFLASQGYHLSGEDPLRRRFANALQWYISLHDHTMAAVEGKVHEVRSEMIPEASIPASDPASVDEDGVNEAEANAEAGPSGKRRRGDDDSESEEEEEEQLGSEPTSPPLQRPTEYLRSRCPLCFGGSGASAIVCLDACFTQKHNAKGARDYPRAHPDSFYVPEGETQTWKEFVDTVRQPPARPRAKKKQKTTGQDSRSRRTGEADGEEEVIEDDIEEGMRVPKHVLNGYEASFTAADEARVKGSTQFFDVTAKMALLCRHDRPLWVVNMNTAGEGQHYTLVLLWKLFENLPPDFRVELLYDIACQLHRSCVKWGLLKPYMTRLRFAVSIFHAFGHQWACQLVYHPRKCIGYGLADGEGAERLWHALSRLIAYCRVAGYYLRMYTLDSQLNHMNDEGLLKLGSWLSRKLRACKTKLREANAALAETGQPEELLRREWAAQVAAQTQPLPRQERNKGKKAVEEAIRLRKSQDVLRQRLNDLQKRIASAASPEWDIAIAELEVDSVRDSLRKAEEAVVTKERALGVSEKQELRHLVKSPFVHKRMNARALKIRIRSRLRERKFELDRLQRAYRKQRSEQRINDHTEDSVKRRDPGIAELARKYNVLCRNMKQLILTNKAPRNARAPPEIDMDKLFSLDVDDDIYLDIGFDYEDGDEPPPLWLANEKVRSGIRALLDRDRCKEELERIELERNAMQEWFSEEWVVTEAAMEREDEDSAWLYQLKRRQAKLACLFANWERVIDEIPHAEHLPEWGLSDDQKHEARAVLVLGGGVVEIEGEADFDAEFEEDVDVLLTEHLESLRISENYRDRENTQSFDEV